MDSNYSDIDGKVVISEFQSTIRLDGSLVKTTVSIQPILKNVVSVWLSSYVIRGVPIIAGIPVESNYFLVIDGLPMRQRVTIADDPVGNGFPLILKGAYTQVDLERAQSITSDDATSCNQLTFRLLNPDGSPAVYDSCVLHLTFITKTQPTSLGKVISNYPEVQHNLTFIARPYVR